MQIAAHMSAQVTDAKTLEEKARKAGKALERNVEEEEEAEKAVAEGEAEEKKGEELVKASTPPAGMPVERGLVLESFRVECFDGSRGSPWPYLYRP